jgi:hypothetical protein
MPTRRDRSRNKPASARSVLNRDVNATIGVAREARNAKRRRYLIGTWIPPNKTPCVPGHRVSIQDSTSRFTSNLYGKADAIAGGPAKPVISILPLQVVVRPRTAGKPRTIR